ncbi:MAG TPA: thioesterase domain-containing protein, partial [Sphingobium sp.]|nr:thioesterase domain-containing protein [Sphingobium sp.]
ETLLYRTLAMQLQGPPVYGIQPERHPDGAYVHASIVDLARSHVSRLRQVQPSGPYMLAGLCAGGVIAVEMARQLEVEGEEVSFVGIIDAADVEALERPFHEMRLRWSRVRDVIGRTSLTGIGALVPRLMRKFGNMLSYELSSRLERRRMDQAVASATRSGEAAPATLAFLDLYKAAHRRHRPRGLICAQKVVLFKATQGNGAPDDSPYCAQFADHAFGWGRRVANHIEVVDIPGGHSSALQEPNVGTLARLMQEAIDEVLVAQAGPILPVTDGEVAGAPVEPIMTAAMS